MRGPNPSPLLLALALLALPVAASAGPVDRVDKLLADDRFEDAAQTARKWLERNGESGESVEMLERLAEAEFQRVLQAPSLARTLAWREEFGDSARRADLDSLEANLRLYAAAEVGTEAAYLEVADTWAGTAAALEALSRAEDLAFKAAQADGSADALSAFLGAYDALAHADEALALWREAAWIRAEQIDTARIWQDLRMQDPEHPRAAIAILREQERALEELGPEAKAGALMKLARRYADGPTGWQALRRATDHAVLRAFDPEGGLLLNVPLGPGPEPSKISLSLGPAARIELVHGGRLPRGAVIEVSVHALIEDRPVPWQRATFRQSARWGVRPDPASPTPPSTGGGFHTDKALCRGDLLAAAQIQVLVRLGDESATWIRPATLDHPCGGPLPWAVQRAEGRAQRLRHEDREQPLGGTWLEREWPCDGPMLVHAEGVSAGCGGWALQPFGDGTLIRKPGAAVPAFEDGDSPWLDLLAGDDWRALDVPDAWHYGGAPTCPLGPGELSAKGSAEEPIAGEAPAPAAGAGDGAPSSAAGAGVGAPEETVEEAASETAWNVALDLGTEPANRPPDPLQAPTWLPEGTPTWSRDVDGDGLPDWLAAHGAPGAGQLVFAGGPLPAAVVWVAPWPIDADPSTAGLSRDGCSLVWMPGP